MQFASVAAAEVTGFHRKGETRLGEEFDVTNQLQPAAVPSKTVAVEEKNKLLYTMSKCLLYHQKCKIWLGLGFEFAFKQEWNVFFM